MASRSPVPMDVLCAIQKYLSKSGSVTGRHLAIYADLSNGVAGAHLLTLFGAEILGRRLEFVKSTHTTRWVYSYTATGEERLAKIITGEEAAIESLPIHGTGPSRLEFGTARQCLALSPGSPVTVTEIAFALGASKGGVAIHLNRWAEWGWFEVLPKKGAATRYTMSPLGREKLQALLNTAAETSVQSPDRVLLEYLLTALGESGRQTVTVSQVAEGIGQSEILTRSYLAQLALNQIVAYWPLDESRRRIGWGAAGSQRARERLKELGGPPNKT